LTEIFTDEPLPFVAPLTENWHVPPTATAMIVPSPPPEGVEVGAPVGAEVAVAVTLGLTVGVGGVDVVVDVVAPPVGLAVGMGPGTGATAAEVAAGGGSFMATGDGAADGVSVTVGAVGAALTEGAGTDTAPVASVAEPEPSDFPP
jgi:hypothetical protein